MPCCFKYKFQSNCFNNKFLRETMPEFLNNPRINKNTWKYFITIIRLAPKMGCRMQVELFSAIIMTVRHCSFPNQSSLWVTNHIYYYLVNHGFHQKTIRGQILTPQAESSLAWQPFSWNGSFAERKGQQWAAKAMLHSPPQVLTSCDQNLVICPLSLTGLTLQWQYGIIRASALSCHYWYEGPTHQKFMWISWWQNLGQLEPAANQNSSFIVTDHSSHQRLHCMLLWKL
jgi:hypothetical protein